VKVLFVSVDAQSDTPAVLARYVRHFNPDFVGATAPMEGLHLLTRQLTADFARVGGDVPGEYWFDHSASIFLIAPDLRVVAEFTPPLDASELAVQVRHIVRFINVHG
jgi:protein SCO1/2